LPSVDQTISKPKKKSDSVAYYPHIHTYIILLHHFSFYAQGNVTFKSQEETTQPADSSVINCVAAMLNVTSGELSKALSGRVIAARGEVMQKIHTLPEAEYGRDALAKVNIIHLFNT
jgi:myosin-1